MSAATTAPLTPSDPQSGPLEYLSASRLKCFQECRLKFYFRYIEKLPSSTSPALVIGTITHAVLQQWNLARWRGEPSDTKAMWPVFMEHWMKELEGKDINWKGKEEASRDNTWAMLEHYFSETPVPVEEKPEAVEVIVERDLIAHGLPPLRGVIDLVREGGCIVDFKTAARSPTPSTVAHQHELQLGCYALLYREATGHQESGFEIHHLVKTKEPKLIVSAMEPMTPHQTRRLLRQMESYVAGIMEEDFVPSPGQHCAWCDYYAQCRAWEGGLSL